MDTLKIRTIVYKEWAEVFKNRIVLFSVAFLPLILTALPIVMLAFTGSMTEAEAMSELTTADMEFFGDQCIGLNAADCTNVYTLNIFTIMFMILPVAIPSTIAAYSIVGEKNARSLEPLLATPITTVELLAGKMIAAIIPAIIATWGAFIIYLVSARFLVNEVVFGRLLDPMWIIAIFIVGPLFTLLAVSFGIMVSSRVSDPRVAEQLSTLVILPIILLVVGQSANFLILDTGLVVIIAFITLVLDAILLFFVIRVFERENILTRWQ